MGIDWPVKNHKMAVIEAKGGSSLRQDVARADNLIVFDWLQRHAKASQPPRYGV